MGIHHHTENNPKGRGKTTTSLALYLLDITFSYKLRERNTVL